ncbi:MAG: hypothetical protein J7K66_02775 [Anaerolineaceae bacterium]|nr:hypothetical protein [Anaerolineaceae bacterium]
MNGISVGRLLRSNTRRCVVGCHITRTTPAFGSMVYIPTEIGRVFGLVYDIHIDDDGLVRQLAAAGSIPDEVIFDNRTNRNVPVEMSIIFIGYSTDKKISHLLPPRPPLSLDEMYICNSEELRNFTNAGHFGYLRHIISDPEIPSGELLSAHLQFVNAAQRDGGNPNWINEAIQEIIILLRDNHELMTNVLGAISDAFSAFN